MEGHAPTKPKDEAMSARLWWLSAAVFWIFTLYVIFSGYGPWWIILTPTICVLRLPSMLAAREREAEQIAAAAAAIPIEHRLIRVPEWVGHAHTPHEFIPGNSNTHSFEAADADWNEEVHVVQQGWIFRLHRDDLEVTREDTFSPKATWEKVRATPSLGITCDDLAQIKEDLTSLRRPRPEVS